MISYMQVLSIQFPSYVSFPLDCLSIQLIIEITKLSPHSPRFHFPFPKLRTEIRHKPFVCSWTKVYISSTQNPIHTVSTEIAL